MTDLAELGLVVKSGQVVKATNSLDGLTASGARAEATVGGLGATSQATNTKLGTLSKTAKALAGSFVAIAAGVVLTKSVSEFAAFEKALIGVGKTTNILGDDLKELGKEITLLSRILPNGTVELSGIAQAAGQLGVSGSANILKFTKTVAELGSATNLSGEEAATTLARLLTVTGEAISSVDVLGSVIVRLGNNFAATESEIAGAATRVAQATSLFKTSSADVAAIGTAMAAIGVQAEAGGTVIGRAFSLINKAIQEGGEKMKILEELTGKTGDTLKKAFSENSTNVFQDFIEGLGNIPRTEVTSYLEKLELGGVRVEAVLGTMAVRSEVVAEALGQARDELENTTALATESEVALQAFANQMEIVGNNASELKTALGEAIAPTLLAAAKTLGSAMLYFAENLDKVMATAELLAVAIGSKLVGAFVAKRAAMGASIAATQAVNAATLKQTEFTLLAAQAELKMSLAMAQGIARRNAIVAATARVVEANKAHAASLAAVGGAAAGAARSMGILRGAMAFLGGPVGVAILGLYAAYKALTYQTKESASAQKEYNRVMKTGKTEIDAATASTRELLIEKNKELINIKMLTQARIQDQAASVKADIAAQAGKNKRTPASATQIAELKRLGDAYAKLDKEITTLIENASGGSRVVKNIGEKLRQEAEANAKAIGLTADVTCKAAAETGTCAERLQKRLKKENDELQRMSTAVAKGEAAVKKLNTELKAEELIRENGIDIKSEEADKIKEMVAVNDAYTEGIENQIDAQEKAKDAAKDAAEAQKRAAEENLRLLQEPFLNAIKGIQSASTDMFKDILDGGINSFNDLGDSLLDIFKQILAEMATLAIARPIIVPIVGAIGGMFGVTGIAGAGGGMGAVGTASSALSGFSGLSSLSSLASGTFSLAGLSTGSSLAMSNIGAAGYTGAFSSNLSLASSSFSSGAYGTAAGALAPYIPILGAGIAGYLQGGWAGAAGGAGGAWAGAELGTMIMPGIGTIIGGILGGLFGSSLFGGGGSKKVRVETATFGDYVGRGQEGPFGFVDVWGRNTSKFSGDLERALVSLDENIDSLLTSTESAQVAAYLQGKPTKESVGNRFGDENLFDIFESRLEDIFDGLGVTREKFDELTEGLERSEAGAQQLIAVTTAWLAGRAELEKTVKLFGYMQEPLSEVEVAIRGIEKTTKDLIDAAEEFERMDLVPDIEQGEANAKHNLKSAFEANILSQILGITDPLAAELFAFDQIAAQRISDAELLGANIADVELLNAIQREQIIYNSNKAINDSFIAMYENIDNYVSNMGLKDISPLTPQERLAEAERTYKETLRGAWSGDPESIANLTNAADSLLTEAANMYAGTAGFTNRYDFVESNLDRLLEKQPGVMELTDPVVTAIDNLGISETYSSAQIIELLIDIRDGTVTKTADEIDAINLGEAAEA